MCPMLIQRVLCWFCVCQQASRAQILKQATDYIQFMTKKSNTIQHDIDDLKKQNSMLESQSEMS